MSYEKEAHERWGKADAYREYSRKTASYTEEKWQEVNRGLNEIFARLGKLNEEGLSPTSDSAKALVKELQGYITENYYTCTDEILASLGETYATDERFRENIDKYGEGTALFTSKAIEAYLGKAL